MVLHIFRVCIFCWRTAICWAIIYSKGSAWCTCSTFTWTFWYLICYFI